MTRVIKVTDKSPRLTVQDFDNSPNDDCRCMILTSQMVTVIRAAIWPGFTWPTRFGRWVRPDLFELSSEADYLELQDVLAELDYKLSGDEMANCFEVLAGPLGEIATALGKIQINNTCGCGGECGTPGGTGPYQGYLDDGTPILGNGGLSDATENPEGDPPEGFDTWEDYYLHKCRVANYLVDIAINWLNQASVVSNLEAAAASVSLVAIFALWSGPIPEAVIGAILAAIFALKVVEGVLTDASEAIAADRQGGVCALYSSETAQAAMDAVGSKIDETLETLALAANLHWAIKLIAAFLFSTDAVNELFEYGIEVNYPDADCSACGQEGLVYINSYEGTVCGTLYSGSLADDFVIESTLAPAFGDMRQSIRLKVVGAGAVTFTYEIDYNPPQPEGYFIDWIDPTDQYGYISWHLVPLQGSPKDAKELSFVWNPIDAETKFRVAFHVEPV